MTHFITILQSMSIDVIFHGLILSFVTLGIFIPFRLLNMADLTGEGSYPLGGAITATLLLYGAHPLIAIFTAMIGAGIAGAFTGLIKNICNIEILLSGIIVSTMLFSINLGIMHKPNVPFFSLQTIFWICNKNNICKIGIIITFMVFLAGTLIYFLKSERGLRFRTVGYNPQCAQRQGINTSKNIIAGLCAGNGLIGLAGSLMAQAQGYTDIGMGIGIVINALAALMIGETIIKPKTIMRHIAAIIVGSLLYQFIQGFILILGVAPIHLRLLTGCIVLIMTYVSKS